MALTQNVPAPQRQARSGGIKDIVGDFTTVERLGHTEGITWDSVGCTFPRPTRAGCIDEVTESVDKTGDGVVIENGIGIPFALYSGVACFVGGDNEGPSYTDQAQALLSAGEDRAVEAKLWAWIDAGTDTAAASLAAAIGAAEEHADANYIGQPVLVLSREDVISAKAAGILERIDGQLVSPNKTPVLSTSAATTGVVGIIGRPAVYATTAVAFRAPDLAANTDFAIAERIYAVGVDCNYRRTYTVTIPAP